MKNKWIAGAFLVANVSGTAAQACAAGSATQIKGNWYCQAVNAISYVNFGTAGSYNKVTSMQQGTCGSTPFSYGGGMSPLDEEVSWHFRGPLSLKQFAFYSPGSIPTKRDVGALVFESHHAHQHFHAHDKEIRELQERHLVHETLKAKRVVGEEVYATIDGVLASWVNEYSGPGSAAATSTTASDVGESTTVASAAPSMNAGSGNWGRQAYYHAVDGKTEGLVFLNHNGGEGSGEFDYTWGNSLSYASCDGNTGVASPVTLADTMLDDNIEIVVMTSNECRDDCGTIRPGTVAYHGFGGASKVFLLEFSMPLTGKTGFNMDMPAAWILNAQIPRTMQYGNATCSCWESGCGELDVFEILDSGNVRAKSTYHGNPSGGDSNYFQRPTGPTIKAAVIMDGISATTHIVILPNDTTFDITLASSVIDGFVNTSASPALKSLFNLAS